MRISRIGPMTALFALALSACSEFSSSGDPLSEAEASDLAGALVGQGFPGFGGVDAAPRAMAPSASSAAPAEKLTITINDSGPCQGGGSVALAGTLTADFNQQAQTGTLEYKYTLSPNACVITTQGGKTFTVTGDPNLSGEGKLDVTSSAFTGTLKYSGKFGWEGDSRSGACGVSLEAKFDLSLTTVNRSASVTGTVCGVNVNRSVLLEA